MRYSLMTGAGLAALLALGRVDAHAQVASNVGTCNTPTLGTGSQQLTMNNGGQLCVAANVTASATFTGFTPTPPSGSYATLTATGSSATTTLPTGVTDIVYNTGTLAVSCQLGATAATGKDIIQPGGALVEVPGTATAIACIDQTGTSSSLVVISGGSGTPTLSGGQSGGAGGVSSTVTLAAGSANVGSVVASGTVSVAGTVPVSGTVTANGTVGISGTVPVSGTVGVSGTVPVFQALDFGFVAGTSARVKNTVTISGTTTETLLAATVGLHNYVTDLMCFRTDTGTTIAYVTLNDDNSTPDPLPQGSGAGPPINVPIVSNGTNTAITFTSQAGITGTCTVRGYSGTWLLDDLPAEALPAEEGRAHLAWLDDLNNGLANG